MPFCIESPTPTRCVVAYQGNMDVTGGLDMLAALHDWMVERGPRREVMFDLRGLGALSIMPGDVPQLIEHIRRYENVAGPGRTAWIAPTTHVDLVTIANLLVALMQRGTAPCRLRKGFTSVEEADAWLRETEAPTTVTEP